MANRIVCVDDPPDGLIRVAFRFNAQVLQMLAEIECLAVSWTLVEVHTQNLGDDFAGLLNQDGVARPNILASYFILVV